LGGGNPTLLILTIMTKETKQKMYESLKLKYEAQILEAEATLMIYLENAAGIGEHPQIIEEMDNFVEKLANASDKLQTFNEFWKYYGNKENN
jgi:hypothetical protein